jgi:Recombination endonuclease VII
MRRLKVSEVATERSTLLLAQGLRCALCKLPCSLAQAVLDHDHGTGAIRATLHRGCNSLLGKVENNYKRYGVINLAAFLSGLSSYLQAHMTNQTSLIHPTHKTEEEKRLSRNAKARKARAKSKESS